MPQYGHLAAVSSANALIISDRSANIARIQDLVRQLDRAESNDYGVLNLQHGWAVDIAEVLRNSLVRGEAKSTAGVQIIADSRTNRLIFIGPSEARSKLAALAQTLDTPTTRSANTRVIRLRHGDAKSWPRPGRHIGRSEEPRRRRSHDQPPTEHPHPCR